jgi:squalene-hopene/tetraprenyl-beta-curcumene cyclase
MRALLLILCFPLIAVGTARADAHLEGYKAEANEPIVREASVPKASHFLEAISLKWTRQNRCGTCHTNLAYMMARPFLAERDKAIEKEIRDELFAYLADYNPGPVAPAEQYDNNNVLWNRLPIASAIAIGDGEDGVAQDARTLKRFDDIWAMQEADGSFRWPKQPLPFLEGDPYFVDTLVALGAGYLPAGYLHTAAAAAGMKRLRRYLGAAPTQNLHNELLLMWASVKTPALMNAEKKASVTDKALSLQRNDGGWSLASLGDWIRKDGAPNDKVNGPSDGYGTGFVLFTLCKSGLAATSPAVRRGLAWLDSHQRESGRWFTKSLWSDDFHNYVSTVGTAYDVMALRECKH